MVMPCIGARVKGVPAKETFLVDQTPPASGFLLGNVASTDKGAVTLRFPCGHVEEDDDAITVCELMDINEKLLFSVHRAGSNESVENLIKHGGYQDLNPIVNVVHRPPGLGPLLREASIVRDPKGVIIGMLATDRTEPQSDLLSELTFGQAKGLSMILEAQPASYSGYAARPRFAGQAAAMTVEGVPMYAWFTFFAPGGGRVDAGWLFPNGGRGFRNSMIYLHGPAGLEPQRAYDYRLEGPTPLSVNDTYDAASHFPWMFTVREARGDYKGPMPGTSPTLIQKITGPFKAILGDFVPRAPAGVTEAGVAYGDTIDTGKEGKPSTHWSWIKENFNRNCKCEKEACAICPNHQGDEGGRCSTAPPRLIHHEVTIAQGMDAGLVVMAAFCPGLLNAEYFSAEQIRSEAKYGH